MRKVRGPTISLQSHAIIGRCALLSCQGSEVVKEDLLDDIIKESSPYKAPEKIMTRSDLASDFAKPKTYSPDESVEIKALLWC